MADVLQLRSAFLSVMLPTVGVELKVPVAIVTFVPLERALLIELAKMVEVAPAVYVLA